MRWLRECSKPMTPNRIGASHWMPALISKNDCLRLFGGLRKSSFLTPGGQRVATPGVLPSALVMKGLSAGRGSGAAARIPGARRLVAQMTEAGASRSSRCSLGRFRASRADSSRREVLCPGGQSACESAEFSVWLARCMTDCTPLWRLSGCGRGVCTSRRPGYARPSQCSVVCGARS